MSYLPTAARAARDGPRHYDSMEHFRAASLEPFESRWHFSHAVAARGLLVLSGVTATSVEGVISSDPAEQFEQAFVHLRLYLEAAGASLGDVVELTSYHVDLRQHLDVFMAAKDRHLVAPYRPGRRSVSRS